MTFFLDNDLSPRLARILQLVDADARHLREDFLPETADELWLPEVASRGWVVVTADEGIRRNPSRRAVLESCGVTALFLPKTYLRKRHRQQVSWIVGHLDRIEEQVAALPPGTCARVTDRGKIERLA